MNLYKYLFIFTLITVVGCTKKTIKIPVLNVAGIQDTIYDNSQIWIFAEEKDGDTIATLNRKNSIATTSWIYNIDKNLPMSLVVPYLQKLTEKREKPALHEKDEDDFNYFSYVDSDANLLSMVKFDVIYFDTNKSIDKNSFLKDTLNKHVVIDYNQKGLAINDSVISIDNLNNYFVKRSPEKKTTVHLTFDKDLKYEDYLLLKARLQNSNNIKLDTIEFVN
ncbi:hypothetical protein FF125_13520 [Aureibaculum algae]|uniref:Uncharacterized protein n=1 Tax=Aureibaculum algae TaxID=2584122 RepID=A0A5B7TWY5_9FLAO|nr:hypothetical protein [Aureibaculum algae]QCX39407.1 hypothetical protein FF125_13520 [Aureibaculum algae]